MPHSHDDITSDPAAMRRVIDDSRDLVDRGLRESCERTFGFSQDLLLSEPDLLEPYLDHADSGLRADTITFIAIHYARLGKHFKQFPRHCVDLARGANAAGRVRGAAVQALGWLFTRTGDTRLLVELARLILDSQVEAAIRAKAYATFVSSIDAGAIQGGYRAFLNLKAVQIDHQPLSDVELNFVRSALTHFCPSETGYSSNR